MTKTILAMILGYACGAMSMLSEHPGLFLVAAILATFIVAVHGGRIQFGRWRG